MAPTWLALALALLLLLFVANGCCCMLPSWTAVARPMLAIGAMGTEEEEGEEEDCGGQLCGRA